MNDRLSLFTHLLTHREGVTLKRNAYNEIHLGTP